MNTHELTTEIQFNSSYSESLKLKKRVSTVFLVVLGSFAISALPLAAMLLTGENLTQNPATPIITTVWQVLGEKD